MAYPLGPGALARRHGGGLRAGGVKALPLLVLAVLLGPLGAGGEPGVAMVARLIAEAKADMRVQIEATEAKVEAERERAREGLAAVLGRLNRTEADLRQTRGDLSRMETDLNHTKTDLTLTRVALRGAEGRLTRCEANASALAWLHDAWKARRLQSQGPTSQGEAVELFRRNMAHLALPAGLGGHRRLEEASCDPETVKLRSDAVNDECCNEPGEDCSGGRPHSANADCCAVLVPLFRDCAAQMGADAAAARDALALCPAGGARPAPTASAVLLFSAVCPPGVLLETCIPICDSTTNGFVLLLNQVRRHRRPEGLLRPVRRDDTPRRARRTAMTCACSARCRISSSRSAPAPVFKYPFHHVNPVCTAWLYECAGIREGCVKGA
jgi:hypothetical protein